MDWKTRLGAALLLAAMTAMLGGCMGVGFTSHSWPPDEPKQAAEPAPQKPCKVMQNKDGTVGTSC
jgi:hypothetical protein